MPQWIRDLISGKSPTADSLRSIEGDLQQQGWQLIWNADGSRADLVSPDGTLWDAIAGQGGGSPSWSWQNLGSAPRGSGSTHWTPLPGFEDQARSSGVPGGSLHGGGSISGGGGGGDRTISGGGTVGSFFSGTSELHGDPAPLPEGYSMEETRTPFGTGIGTEYPLTSVQAPGLAKPWTEAFDPQIDVYEQSPGYQFRMQEGLNAIERGAAAKGTLLTGGTMKDLTRWAQDYASSEYDKIYGRLRSEYGLAYDIYKQNQADIYNKLAGLSGTGQTSAQSLGQQAGQYGARVGDLLTQQGNVNAAGVVGQQQAWQPFLSTVGNVATGALPGGGGGGGGAPSGSSYSQPNLTYGVPAGTGRPVVPA